MLMNAKRMSTDLEAVEQYVPDSEQFFFVLWHRSYSWLCSYPIFWLQVKNMCLPSIATQIILSLVCLASFVYVLSAMSLRAQSFYDVAIVGRNSFFLCLD